MTAAAPPPARRAENRSTGHSGRNKPRFRADTAPTGGPTGWMDHARCRYGDPDWTGEHQPDKHTYRRLAAICATCPVQTPCAVHALATDAQAGMYAGVWLPVIGCSGHVNKRWLDARTQLQQLAAKGIPE